MASSRKPLSVRSDSMGGGVHGHHHPSNDRGFTFDSLTYVTDESDVWRAHQATDHYLHRGKFWNKGKHETSVRYIYLALVGIVQATVAYLTNISSSYFIKSKYTNIYNLLQEGLVVKAFFRFVFIQVVFAMVASSFVWIEPVAAGSGIPEVKCYLNGIDIPRVGELKTLVCKVLGVICSVSAGLPVGKEGPMIHSGSVVATTISSRRTKNDKEKRDFVACGAAAGVCTAFSAPIGGILFSLEEGASYWCPSLTWRAFFCSMIALTSLYLLNTIGSAFGKVGFNKLFSFGNFVFQGRESSFAVFELFLFVLVGVIGGLIGAMFNHTNEKITLWRMKHVNYSKKRRFVEVVIVASLVSVVSFILPLCWHYCTPIPEKAHFTADQQQLLEDLVPFRCIKGKEYNEVATLIFTDAGDAIRQLFHLHHHAFSTGALVVFFTSYISLAVLVYGIAIPSGLFVPSLLSGAAFGRLFGNVAQKLEPNLAFSNTYALVGAAAVLGGMARMTISLTVILLECTGNEQFVLPLMLTLMSSRIVGGLFNSDLYHIHIHLKRGINFLETELQSNTRHHNLVAGQIMSENVIFVRPVEKVGVVYDILKSCNHTNFPVVDTDDKGILYGTIGRSALCILLKQRAFGLPMEESSLHGSISCNYIELDPDDQKFLPVVPWNQIEKAYPKYPSINDIRINSADRGMFVDLRPYTNTAALTIQEASSVTRTYQLFRSVGARFLPVVNRYNQCVGTITRTDLTPEALGETMLRLGKKHV